MLGSRRLIVVTATSLSCRCLEEVGAATSRKETRQVCALESHTQETRSLDNAAVLKRQPAWWILPK